MSSSSVTLLVTVIIGLGVVSAGVWRVASAVSKLVARVDLLAYRLEKVEKTQARLVRVSTRRASRRSGSTGD